MRSLDFLNQKIYFIRHVTSSDDDMIDRKVDPIFPSSTFSNISREKMKFNKKNIVREMEAVFQLRARVF